MAVFKVSTRELQYGPNAWQMCTNVFPHFDNPANTDAPIMIFIHGGGWVEGDKNDILTKVKDFVARTGFPALNINYKLSDINQQVQDVAAAITLSKLQSCSNGTYYLYGYSAGGHIAALSAQLVGDSGLLGVAGVGAPLFLENWAGLYPGVIQQNLIPAMGENWIDYSLSNVALGNFLHPILLMHGTEDWLVPSEVNSDFALLWSQTRLKEIGGNHSLVGREDVEFSEFLKYASGCS